MSETPLDPQPGRSPMPEADIGDDTESIPGVGPTDAGDQPPEGAGDDTGGPDTQLSPTKD